MTHRHTLPAWLLDCVRCPIAGLPLHRAPAEVLASLASRGAAGQLATRVGRTVSAPPTQGLLSSDGRWFYGVVDGLATLVPDEAIEVGGIDGFLGGK